VIEKPVFLVGAGRSGSTLMFEILAAHSDLAWFSGYFRRLPRFPAIALLSRLVDLRPGFRDSVAGQGERRRSWLERARIGPDEAYPVWERCCGEKFLYEYLLALRASEEERRCMRGTVAKVLRYQGKPRFAAKVTGPARIGYLSSIFEDALFVHVIRDGRAVVESLMRVPFWKDSYRMQEPAWRGGLTDEHLARWREQDASPLGLAAVQWCAILDTARREASELAPGRYAEILYEDFVRDPHRVLDEIVEFCRLRRDPGPHDFLDRRVELRDLSHRWRERLEPEQLGMLNGLMGESLRELGYSDDATARSGAGGLMRPFAS
jgi:hypothetical protein